ncbi:MAG TPA: hypothetical protein PLQ93_08735 [Bacteroidia bacterium]|nr:hypothetical protein [Bacteroidia bacterium]
MKTIFLALPLALLLDSCGSSSADEHQSMSDSLAAGTKTEDSGPVNDTTKFKFDFALANIPSPANRMQDIVALGQPYDNTIMHSPAKANAYNNEFKRGLNMGIYNMDMAYAMMNNAGQDVLNYMRTIIGLSEALGMQSSINAMVGKRFESNIGNRDSLFSVWDEILIKSDTYLRSNERIYTASLVFTGSWLESLYLSCKIGEKDQDPAHREKIRTNLWEQRMHLGNLVKLFNDYKDKKECSDLLKDLDPIYQEIISNRQPSELSDEDMKSISAKLYALREKIIS